MNELQWPQAFRSLAEQLLKFYNKHGQNAGPVLYNACQDQSVAKELLPFLNKFR